MTAEELALAIKKALMDLADTDDWVNEPASTDGLAAAWYAIGKILAENNIQVGWNELW